MIKLQRAYRGCLGTRRRCYKLYTGGRCGIGGLSHLFLSKIWSENISKWIFWNCFLSAAVKSVFKKVHEQIKQKKAKCTKNGPGTYVSGECGENMWKSYPQFSLEKCHKMKLYTELYTLSTFLAPFSCAFFVEKQTAVL